jgi:urease accessory protein UreF
MSPTEQSALRPLPGFEDAQNGAAGLLEEFSALFRQIGSSETLFDLPFPPQSLGADKLAGVSGLQHFLESYHTHLLVPVELPAIVRAFSCSVRGQSRELIGLDRHLAGEALLAPFASASRRVGRCQLERLRPLRDERTVQRYLLAADKGQAQGWHTVVYGLTLAVYSWPLRQGLMIYARQTLAGLAQAASRSQSMSDLACGGFVQTLMAKLPQSVDRVIGEFKIR